MIRRTCLIIATIALATAAVPALAAGGGRTKDPSIVLDQDTTAPHLRGLVTFTTAYPTSVKTPRIQVICYQNGALVYGEAGSIDHAFLLGGGGSLWLTAGGPASCTADLFYFSWNAGQPATVILASTTFAAAG
jgi:hypothetical protein